jgi:hypothetical protein
MTEQLA